MRERLLKEESGFTLPEVMVTIMLMLTVMFALYSIFDMSIRVFSFGNDKTEAVENARLGLEKMERELRAAYPVNKAGGDDTLLMAGTDGDTIIFGNDLNGDRVVDTGAGSSEVITYELSGSSPPALLRNSQPVVEFVRPGGLTFQYLDEYESTTTISSAEIVRVTLEVEVKRGPQAGTQTLTTDVALRNRTK